jgi:hypothetical protein
MGERRETWIVAIAVVIAALLLICAGLFLVTALFGVRVVPG